MLPAFATRMTKRLYLDNLSTARHDAPSPAYRNARPLARNDMSRNAAHVNVEVFGRELEVLEEYETVFTD